MCLHVHTCKHTCMLVCRHRPCYMREFLTFPWPSLVMWLVWVRVSDCFHHCFSVRSANQPNFWLSMCNGTVHVRWWGVGGAEGGGASLSALSAPLSWVQFALLWIFAMGALHLCAEVNIASGWHGRARTHLPAGFLHRPLVIDTSLC